MTFTAGNSLSPDATQSFTLNAISGTDVTTYHNDNFRTGLNFTETALTTANVNSGTFGLLRNLSVDGLVDAEPLYLSQLVLPGGTHNVVYFTTEHDSVYAFDSNTGTQLWKVSLLGFAETTSDNHGCNQVTPEIGITSTPVIDLSAGPNGTIFVVAMPEDKNGNYYQRLHALDVTTGSEQTGSPTTITATFPSSSGQVTFAPGQYKERAALLLLNGVIYTTWASHCDFTPYTGWVIGYSESNLKQVSVLNVTPNGGTNADGGIWMSGRGPAADSSGNIYILDGNGAFDTTLNANGFPNQGDYGNAFLKLSTSPSLAVFDYFEMYNQNTENGGDVDLGSGGVMLLPDQTDNLNNVWHLAVGAGKDQNLYVVNRDTLGKYNSTKNNIYQQLNGVFGGRVLSVPAYFNNTVYYGSSGNPLAAFTITNARLSAAPTSTTTATFASPGVLPSISANGNLNGIVWVVENTSTAVLHAFLASNLATEIYNSNQAANGRDHFGAGNKFITPMIADGKVFVATSNSVAVFGLLP